MHHIRSGLRSPVLLCAVSTSYVKVSSGCIFAVLQSFIVHMFRHVHMYYLVHVFNKTHIRVTNTTKSDNNKAVLSRNNIAAHLLRFASGVERVQTLQYYCTVR